MKKLAVVVAALGLYCNVWAQAWITLANSQSAPAGLVLTNNGVTTGRATPFADYRLELFYQPISNPTPTPISFSSGIGNIGSWEQLVGSPIVTVAPVPGVFVGPTETTGPDVAPQAIAWFEVVAWDGGFGSLANAEASGTAHIGESAIWSQPTWGPPPDQPVSTVSYFPGVIIDTPEPSIVALSGICATCLLLFRRRK